MFVCRDGVGAGQIQEVLDNEVASVRKLVESDDIVPGGIKLTFIIVSKRINTRYARQGQSSEYRQSSVKTPIKTSK